MEENDVGLVVVETFSDLKTAQRLADLAGGRAVVLAQEVNALPDVKTYEALFEHNVEALLAAQRELGGSPTKPPTAEAAR
jgi:ABC-type Zn uptake system ZnuABC Zn-binding protein ZnuA